MYNNNHHTDGNEEEQSGRCLQFHQQNLDMPCTRMTSWTSHVKNDEVKHRIKGEGNILCTIKKRGRLNGLVTLCTGTSWNAR
jgi:hypothetical protein